MQSTIGIITPCKTVLLMRRHREVHHGADALLPNSSVTENARHRGVTCPGVRHSFHQSPGPVEDFCQMSIMQSVSQKLTPVLATAFRASSVRPRYHAVRLHTRAVRTARQAFFGVTINSSKLSLSKRIGKAAAKVLKKWSRKCFVQSSSQIISHPFRLQAPPLQARWPSLAAQPPRNPCTNTQ